jgi:TPR repeat protein
VIFRRRRQRTSPDNNNQGGNSQEPEVSFTTLPSETAARQAAEGGSPIEMNRLGVILKTQGRVDEAAVWFEKAAAAGNKDAIGNLGLYLLSQGRNQEAAEWFRRAGDALGDALARNALSGIDDAGSDPGRRPER